MAKQIRVEPLSTSLPTASERLKRGMKSIIETWEKQVRLALPAARNSEKLAVLDSLPAFLEQLSRDLQRPQIEPQRSLRMAKRHGKQRAAQPEYSLDQVLLEYHILRKIIFSKFVTEGETPMSVSEVETVNDTIDRAIAHAAEEFVQSKLQDLEAERVLREKFVSTLTHDLRTPLSAAKMSAQMIARYPERREQHTMFAIRVIDGIDRADKMIQDLLDANRIRAGLGLPLHVTECDLVSVTEEVCEELSSIHGRRFRLRTEGESLLGYWACDSLRRVLENLMINAVKYGAPHTPITVSLSDLGDRVELSVHNEGTPLSPEDQKKLFDPFHRTRSAQISGQTGWGLGLTLVHGLVKEHGGEVKVQSAPELGTTFIIELPKDARPYGRAV